ncbi:hypothetical protein CHS0354_009231 [Potamilus streckersoni]|uniref:Uncharacterized protein n=1 Tax=Potamilus streckersoni TaxID=2493646 RepID=A0AAE0S6P4_9BIVA|nr:hypothetical protein CHS0354_009231 [Potamilus streckersoni]
MTDMDHIAYRNADRMVHGEEPEMYTSHGYHGHTHQGNTASILQARNWIQHYGLHTMTDSQLNMSDEGLGFYQQERAMHRGHEYRPQGDNGNVFKGHKYVSRYGVPPMANNQSNISHVITSQPAAYPDQWVIQTTASHATNSYDEATQSQSKDWILFKRTVSIVFIVIDIVMAWVQISEMDKTVKDVVVSKIYTESSCPKSQPVIVTYIVVMSVSTLFTIAQIVNIIGETVYDLTEGKHGFQFIHGFNEIVVKTIIKDIPQLLLICCDNGGCKLDCTPRVKDPKFTDKVLNHLGNYEIVLLVLNILVMIVRCDIPFDRWQNNFNLCQTLFKC